MRAMVGNPSNVLYAALLFVFIHVLSSTPLRARIVQPIGEGPYRGLFSLLSAVVLVWLIMAYGRAPHEELWAAAPWTHWVPIVVMPFACILFVFGLTTPNPLSVGQEGRIEATEPAAGILKVTRHPLFWSFALWAAAHLPPNGDLASLYLFGAILLLSLVGMPLGRPQERGALRRRLGAVRADHLGHSVRRRDRRAAPSSKLADFSLWRMALGLALYVGLFAGHPMLFGVPVLS